MAQELQQLALLEEESRAPLVQELQQQVRQRQE
jgi:hypothetical protein